MCNKSDFMVGCAISLFIALLISNVILENEIENFYRFNTKVKLKSNYKWFLEK